MTPTSNVKKVPFIDIVRYEKGFLETLLPQIETLLRKGYFSGGPSVGECEAVLKKYSQSSFAIGCANGTDALQLALRAMGVKQGDRVLLPDMTFWASFEAIVNVGAKPITLDVNAETFHLDAATVEEAIEKFNPRALILVHLYGWAAPDTLKIRKICENRGILLLEDSAQAFGTRLNDQSLIGEADVATTSFYPAKVLGASGDAGAVFCKNETVAELTKKLRDHGRCSHYEHDQIGWNSRLGAYEACFLSHALTYLDLRIQQRRKICELYRKELVNLEIQFKNAPLGCTENGYASVATLSPSRRIEFQKYLVENEVESRVIYPGAMSYQPGALAFLEGKIDFGRAQHIAQSVISLPCFSGMTEGETDRVISVVKSFFKKN
jgi:UDP-2-acetamido-2-deoxy-ribo-hexuluronate aminotransferase